MNVVKNNKKALGRGLNSLLGGETYEETKNIPYEEDLEKEENEFDGEIKIRKVSNKEEIKEATSQSDKKEKKKPVKGNEVLKVDINMVKANPDQPRKNFSKQELEELSDSIKRHGLLQPILVTEKDDGYEVIAGERRLRASKLAGLKEVSVIVKDTDDNKKLEIALIENIQREDLNPMEEAYSYNKIIELEGISHAELASLVSKGRSTITNSLRLLDLPEEAQKLLMDEKISAGHARAVLSVNTTMGREKLIKKIIEDKLNVRDAENLANLYNGQNTKALTTVKPPAPKSYKKAATLLKEYFGSPVRVKKAQGKNKVEIEFNDEKDLERILELIVKDN